MTTNVICRGLTSVFGNYLSQKFVFSIYCALVLYQLAMWKSSRMGNAVVFFPVSMVPTQSLLHLVLFYQCKSSPGWQLEWPEEKLTELLPEKLLVETVTSQMHYLIGKKCKIKIENINRQEDGRKTKNIFKSYKKYSFSSSSFICDCKGQILVVLY